MRTLLFVTALSGALMFQPSLGVNADATLPCITDEALQETAAAILLSDQPVDPEQLVELARRAGSDLTAIRGLRLVANDRVMISEWLRRTERDLDADVICG